MLRRLAGVVGLAVLLAAGSASWSALRAATQTQEQACCCCCCKGSEGSEAKDCGSGACPRSAAPSGN